MTTAERLPDYVLRLDTPNVGSPDASYQELATYEIARLLSVIADKLDTIAERMPMAGRGH